MDKRSLQTGIRILKEEGLVSLLKKSYYYLIELLSYPFLLLRFTISKPKYPESLEVAFSSNLIKPAQIKSEIDSLLKLLKKEKPKRMLEIGTGKGGTLLLFSSVLPKRAKIITVDMRGGAFGAGYPYWMIPLLKSYKQKNQELFLVQSDSHRKETLRKIEKLLGKDKLDFLFIDGDHSYYGVERDFSLYHRLVKKGGLIAMHDINANVNGCGTIQFWDELKKNYPDNIEIIDGPNGYGIGVLRV